MKTYCLSRTASRAILSALLVTSLAAPVPALAESVGATPDAAAQEAAPEQPQNSERSAAQQEYERQAENARSEQEALEQQVREAQARFQELAQEAELREAELITVNQQIEQAEADIASLDEQISQTQQQLDSAKETLASTMSETYKEGKPSLLSVALNATTFEDFVSRVQYANKIAEFEESQIRNVRDLQDQLNVQRVELEDQKAALEQQKQDKEKLLVEVQTSVATVAQYQAQLSETIKKKIEEADNAIRQAAIEAARADAEEAQRLADVEAQQRAEEELLRLQAEAAAAATREGANEIAQTFADLTPEIAATSPAGVQSFVAKAYSIIGSGYSWSGYHWTGNPATSWFTCSGVVDYALGLPQYANSPESYYAQVGPRMKYSNDALAYGDLVFYACMGRAPGHVAIYVGNGQVIDSIPNGGVAIRAVDYMPTMGGGPIL